MTTVHTHTHIIYLYNTPHYTVHPSHKQIHKHIQYILCIVLYNTYNGKENKKLWHFLRDYNNSLWKRQIGIIALVTFCAQNKCTFRRLRAIVSVYSFRGRRFIVLFYSRMKSKFCILVRTKDKERVRERKRGGGGGEWGTETIY